MSFLTRYRPADFDEVFGHGTILKAIQKNLNSEFPPTSYIFSGKSGVGKTTVARIAAKKLGATGSAIHEINASQIRGIDAMREDVLKTVHYSMPGSKSKVYVFDEAHGLTKDAQNALLKVLEEPPKGIYFILCTTEPEKLIPAIVTRCELYEFKALPEETLLDVLAEVAEREKLKFIPDVLIHIAERSGGSPRQALNFLEKCSAVLEDLEAAKELIGEGFVEQKSGNLVVGKHLVALLQKRKWGPIAHYLREVLYAERPDITEVRQGLANQLEHEFLFNDNTSERLADLIPLVLDDRNKSDVSFTAVMVKLHNYYTGNSPSGRGVR